MIKVGDKLHHQGKEWNVEFAREPFVHLKNGDDFIIESSHIFWNKLYVEQKQRADELEKRWHKLKKHFIKEKEQSFGMLSWSRNNGVLELMERLQEDDNA